MCFVEALGPLFSCDSALGELYGSLGSLLLACKGARNAVAAMVNKRSARFVAAAELMRSAEGREELAQLIRRLHPHLTVRVQPTGELHPSLSWLANGPLGRAFALRREMLDWGRRLEARDPWASAEVQGSAATLLVLPDGLLAPGFKELSRVADHSPCVAFVRGGGVWLGDGHPMLPMPDVPNVKMVSFAGRDCWRYPRASPEALTLLGADLQIISICGNEWWDAHVCGGNAAAAAAERALQRRISEAIAAGRINEALAMACSLAGAQT